MQPPNASRGRKAYRTSRPKGKGAYEVVTPNYLDDLAYETRALKREEAMKRRNEAIDRDKVKISVGGKRKKTRSKKEITGTQESAPRN